MIILPEPVTRALGVLENAGFDAYVAGRCVRELVLGNSPQDFDIVTNAGLNDILFAFRDYRISDEGMARGEILVNVVGMFIQVSPYRREVFGSRVIYADDLETDLFRRGFTINAMAYSPRTGLVDPFGGHSCLTGEVKRIVAIGENVTKSTRENGKPVTETYYDMSRSFTTAPHRILEAIRRCAEGDYEIEEQTRAAMRSNVSCFEYADKKRIFTELQRIVMGKYAARVLEEYADILKFLLPEIEPCIGLDQHSPHHRFTVWTHIARSVGFALPEPSVRFAMLFHDLGKPECMSIDYTGRGHFKGHAERSRLLAEGIMRRLEFDRALFDEVSWLVYHHDVEIPTDRKALKGLLRELGAVDLRQLIQCEIADNRAKEDETETERVKGLRASLAALDEIEATGECYDISQLAVTKRDLIEYRFVFTEKEADELLAALFDIVLDKPSFNNRLMLLDMAQRSKERLEQLAEEREQRLREQIEREKITHDRRKEPIFSKKKKPL